MNGLLSVKCRHCHANIGNPCVIPGTMQLLQLSPAHPCRMEDAGLTPDYSVVGKYREMFPASATSAAVAVKPTEGQQPPRDDYYVPQGDDGDVQHPDAAEGR